MDASTMPAPTPSAASDSDRFVEEADSVRELFAGDLILTLNERSRGEPPRAFRELFRAMRRATGNI